MQVAVFGWMYYCSQCHNSIMQGQWVVFTAGAMGSGKTHTLRWLWQNGYFPLHAFVQADPDRVRGMLPELKGYIARSPEVCRCLHVL
jgi:hypothetical protein